MFAFRCAALTAFVVGLLAVGSLRAEDKPIPVTAEKLAEAYATNPGDYDKLYKDKMVEVTGVVDIPKAEDVIAKKSWVMLKGFQKTGDPVPTAVRVEVGKDLENLKKGDKVTVIGTARAHNKFVFGADIVDAKIKK
jgi:hypothetical protein